MLPTFIFKKIIPFNSKDYEQALSLRNDLLRKPLGLNLYDDDLSGEMNAYHLGLFWDVSLVAVLLLLPENENTLKMRQVAVRKNFQGQHLGQKLIAFAESFAVIQGYRKIILNARIAAEGFYHKQHYHSVGIPFEELGILHIKMEKFLD